MSTTVSHSELPPLSESASALLEYMRECSCALAADPWRLVTSGREDGKHDQSLVSEAACLELLYEGTHPYLADDGVVDGLYWPRLEQSTE